MDYFIGLQPTCLMLIVVCHPAVFASAVPFMFVGGYVVVFSHPHSHYLLASYLAMMYLIILQHVYPINIIAQYHSVVA